MNARRRRPQNNIARWLPVGSAAGLLVAVVAAGVISGAGGSGDASVSTPPATTVVPSAAPPITQDYGDQVVTGATVTPVQKAPLERTLANGVAGDDVEMVQQRLKDLAFDPGPVDGVFGSLTIQAVWAYEKLVLGVPRTEATGRVTPEMWDHMQDPIEIKPRRGTGGASDHTEIYLPEQVMIVFHADRPALIAHISTGQLNPDGTPFQYCEDITVDTDTQGNPLPEPITKPICGLAKTPPGVFKAYRKVTGTRNGPLGSMWDPTYINQGIAIHGANSVPLEPASHGCIRVSRHLGPIVQQLIDIGDQVLIWDGKKEPEDQTEKDRQMIWDWVDTSRTTTTTSSTTTTSTTTVAPSTTPPTTKPAPTTAPTTAAPTTPPTTAPPTTAAPGGSVPPADDL